MRRTRTKADELDVALQNATQGYMISILDLTKLRPEAARLIAEGSSINEAAAAAVAKFGIKT